MKMTDKLYILYDWSLEKIITFSKRKEAVLAKIGEDVMLGEYVDNYKIIEIDLDEVQE